MNDLIIKHNTFYLLKNKFRNKYNFILPNYDILGLDLYKFENELDKFILENNLLISSKQILENYSIEEKCKLFLSKNEIIELKKLF